MTTFSFKIDSRESKKIKAILKALGVADLKIHEEEEEKIPSKKFAEKVKRARKDYSDGKTVAVNIKNIWDGIE